jgi:hypothetical protein
MLVPAEVQGIIEKNIFLLVNNVDPTSFKFKQKALLLQKEQRHYLKTIRDKQI